MLRQVIVRQYQALEPQSTRLVCQTLANVSDSNVLQGKTTLQSRSHSHCCLMVGCVWMAYLQVVAGDIESMEERVVTQQVAKLYAVRRLQVVVADVQLLDSRYRAQGGGLKSVQENMIREETTLDTGVM